VSVIKPVECDGRSADVLLRQASDQPADPFSITDVDFISMAFDEEGMDGRLAAGERAWRTAELLR